MLLELKNIGKSFSKGWGGQDVPVLKGVNLGLETDEIIGITGKSGAGKSTLGRIIAGILKPDQGEILFNGRDIRSGSRALRRRCQRHIQILFQHPETAFNPKWPLVRSLEEPCRLHNIPFARNTLETYLDWMGLNPEITIRYPSQVSGGELQRMAIVRLLFLSPSVLVLDEPTSMLDVITQAKIIHCLMKLQRERHMSYILITHDLDLADFMCRRTYDISSL